MVRKPPAAAGDRGSVPGVGRSPGGGHGSPPMFSPGESRGQRDPGAAVHGIAESDTTEATFHVAHRVEKNEEA